MMITLGDESTSIIHQMHDMKLKISRNVNQYMERKIQFTRGLLTNRSVGFSKVQESGFCVQGSEVQSQP